MGNILTSGEITTNENRLQFYDPKKQNESVFRKTLHKILAEKVDIVRGDTIYTNQMKALCRTLPQSTDTGADGNYTKLGPASSMSKTSPMLLNNYINVSLPHVIDTMLLTRENIKGIKTDIVKSDIILNLNNNTSGSIDINTITSDKFNSNNGADCIKYMPDMCAKQLYNNNCVKLVGNKWLWDYNNSRCVINNIDTLTKIKFDNLEDGTTVNLNYEYKKIIIDANTIAANNYLFKFIINNNVLATQFWSDNADSYKFIVQHFGSMPFTQLDFQSYILVADSRFANIGTNDEAKIYSIKHGLFINYLTKYEGLYKAPLNMNKILNYGDKTCACVNSSKGVNLNKFASNKCPLFLDADKSIPFDIQLMLDILNNYDMGQVGIPPSIVSNDIKQHIGKYKEVQACLGYYFYDNKFRLVKPKNYDATTQYYDSLMKPYDISKTRTYNLSSPSSSYYTNNYSNTPNKNIADVYIDNKKNNDVTSTRGIGLLDNESFSIYSTKLGNINTAAARGDPYSDNPTCRSLINTDNIFTPEKPFLNMGNFIQPSVVCQNIISISNSISRDININPIMTNVCNNAGPVTIDFYKPPEKTNENCCALTKSITYVILSNFNINIDTNTLSKYNSLFSNFNGVYTSCKSPLIHNESYCSGITDTDNNIFIKNNNPDIYIQFIPYQDSAKKGFNINLIQIVNDVPTTILVSRLFTYTANDSELTEEMCIANSFLSKYILEDSIKLLSPADKQTTITKYVDRNGPVLSTTSIMTDYNWLYDPSLFNDLTSKAGSITLPGVITRSVIDKITSDISSIKNGTKFLLGDNLNEYYVSCDSTTTIWGCGKFILDADNLNSFMILNDGDYNYSKYSTAKYDSREYNNIQNILKQPKSKIIYSPTIYRYILVTPVGPINFIRALSDITNEVIGLGTSRLLKSANIRAVDLGVFINSDTESNFAIDPSITADQTWTILSKSEFDAQLGKIVTNHINIIQLSINNQPAIKITRDMQFNPYSFIDIQNKTQWELTLNNNKWVISKDNTVFFTGLINLLDFSGLPNYWSIAQTGSIYKTVSISTFSQFNIQMSFDTVFIPQLDTFIRDIIDVFLNEQYFNNNSELFISNKTVNYIKSKDSTYGYILLQFGINNINNILLHQRDVGYLLNHLILNIPYIFDNSTNKIIIANISNANAFFDNSTNNSDSTNDTFNYTTNKSAAASSFLSQDFSRPYNVDSFLTNIKLQFTKKVPSIPDAVPLSPTQIESVERYINTVIYDSFYTIPEFNYSGPIIVKYISIPQIIDTTGTSPSISYNFKVYYMYQVTDNIVRSTGNKLINNIISLSITNLVQYTKGSTALNIQETNTPVGDFIYYLNTRLSIIPIVIEGPDLSVHSLDKYIIIPALNTIYISNQANLISTNKNILNNPTTMDNIYSPTTNVLINQSTDSILLWPICIFNKSTLNNIISVNSSRPQLSYDIVLTNQFINLYKLIVDNIKKLNIIVQQCKDNYIGSIAIDELNIMIQNKYTNVMKEMVIKTLVNLFKQYDSIASQTIEYEFNKLPFTANTEPTEFNTFITNTFLKTHVSDITNNITSNIYYSSNNNKYYYKQYMILLSNISIVYSAVSNLILIKLQKEISQYIISITNESTVKLSEEQSLYSNCSMIGTCLANFTELNKLWKKQAPAANLPKPENNIPRRVDNNMAASSELSSGNRIDGTTENKTQTNMDTNLGNMSKNNTASMLGSTTGSQKGDYTDNNSASKTPSPINNIPRPINNIPSSINNIPSTINKTTTDLLKVESKPMEVVKSNKNTLILGGIVIVVGIYFYTKSKPKSIATAPVE